MAYRLEFMGQSTHLEIWGAGLGLFGISCWILGEIIDHYKPQARAQGGFVTGENRNRAGEVIR